MSDRAKEQGSIDGGDHPAAETPNRSRITGFVAVLSGGGSLAAEIVLIHLLARILGGTALATAAAAGAFLGSMGVGSLLSGRLAGRLGRPGWALAGVELGAALWCGAAIWIAPGVEKLADGLDWQPSGATAQVGLHFAVAFLALLIPGALAGAVIPLLSTLSGRARSPGEVVARLWALDSAGAALAGLATGLWLLPSLGASLCLWIVAGGHLFAAVASSRLGPAVMAPEPKHHEESRTDRRRRKGGKRQTKRRREQPEAAPRPVGLVLACLAGAGAVGVGWQALWARLLVLTLPGSLAAPSVMVACWVGGVGLGAWFYHRSATLRNRPGASLGVGQVASAAGALFGVALGAWLRDSLAAARPIPSTVGELAVGAAVSLPAAVAMGLALPAAVDLSSAAGSRLGSVTGRALASDLGGAAIGAFAVPFLLIPSLGLMLAILALALGQAMLGLLVLLRTDLGRRWPAVVAAAALVLAALAARGVDLTPWSRQNGAGGEVELVRLIWGPEAATATVRDPDGTLQLVVDRHHGMGGERGRFIERRQGHIPLLLHGEARSVAVLGVGTGNTLGAVTQHDVVRIDAAESLGSVLGMLDLFAESNRQVWRDGRLRLHRVEGHAFLRRSPERYDVIVTDLVHPWRSGAQALYTREHLRLVRRRLAPGGLFCFWIPLHQLDRETLAVVAATFLDAFGEGTMLLGHLGWRQPIAALIAGGRDDAFRRERLLGILGREPASWLVEADLDQPEDIQSLYLGGSELLRELAGEAEVTTWERPVLASLAARTWWQGTEGLGQRTLEQLRSARRPAVEVTGDDPIAATRHRAVGIFLEAELAEASGEAETALRGYAEATRADPSFGLPQLAMELLRRRTTP